MLQLKCALLYCKAFALFSVQQVPLKSSWMQNVLVRSIYTLSNVRLGQVVSPKHVKAWCTVAINAWFHEVINIFNVLIICPIIIYKLLYVIQYPLLKRVVRWIPILSWMLMSRYWCKDFVATSAIGHRIIFLLSRIVIPYFTIIRLICRQP